MDFKAIYAEQLGFVRGLVRKRGIPERWVEDVVQDCFFNVYKGLHTYEAKAPFRSWLAGVVRNTCCLSFRKRANAIQHKELDTRIPDSADPEEAFFTAHREHLARTAVEVELSRLSPAQRESFELYEFGELPASQIADSMGTTENAIRMRVRAAREAMRYRARHNEHCEEWLEVAT